MSDTNAVNRLNVCACARTLSTRPGLTCPSVNRRLLPLLLAFGLLAPLPGQVFAQADSPAPPNAARLLVADAGDTTASAQPGLLDRFLELAASSVGRSQRPVAGARSAAEALAADYQPGLALLCDRGSMGALGFTRQCLLARLEVDQASLPGYGRGAGLSGAWFVEQAGIDLSFGLSWLSVDQPQRYSAPGRGTIPLPGLMDLSPLELNLPSGSVDAGMLQIGGSITLGEDSWLRLEAQGVRSRGRSVDLWGTTVPVIDSDALRISAGRGDFSGSLTGRVMEFDGTPGTLNSLDLGLSWRTPWRGELTFGATQYWSRGDSSRWPLRELPPASEDSNTARVPYVRYHQDL